MIPRSVWRVWLDDPLPETLRRYGKEWDRLHPYWLNYTWRSTDEVTPLRDQRNQRLFDEAESYTADHKRFRSDIVRLDLLLVHGGVYVDCDVQPLRPLDDLLGPASCVVGWSPNGNALTNAFMAAEPGHPFIERCVNTLQESVDEYPPGTHIARVVGPWHITRAYNSMSDKRSVTVLEPGYLFPQSIRERDSGAEPDLSRAWVYHRWATSLKQRGGNL